MFFGLQVDRGNLVQAAADDLLSDLHINTNGKANVLVVTCLSSDASRLQLWKHHLSGLLPPRRAPITVGLEETRARSMDSNANHPLVDCRHVSMYASQQNWTLRHSLPC